MWEIVWEEVHNIIEYGHIIPVNDTIKHMNSKHCPCGPCVNEEGIFVHNAWDGRELFGEIEGEVN